MQVSSNDFDAPKQINGRKRLMTQNVANFQTSTLADEHFQP